MSTRVNTTMNTPMSTTTMTGERDSYGDYILRTGQGLVGQFENLLGAHWYRNKFAGQSPVLDLGPGRCWFTRQNASAVVAVDNSPELVAHFSREGLNIQLGEAYQIPFADGYFEGVFCCWLFEHLGEPQRAMREIYRVLRPGGYACLIVPSAGDLRAFYDDYTHVRPFTRTSLRQLAEDAGFARHRQEFLPCTRGIAQLLRFLGPGAAGGYLRFSERWLRAAGVVNRNNLMLEAWKPQAGRECESR